MKNGNWIFFLVTVLLISQFLLVHPLEWNEIPILEPVWSNTYSNIDGSVFERSDGSLIIAGYRYAGQFGGCDFFRLSQLCIDEHGSQVWRNDYDELFAGGGMICEGDYYLMTGISTFFCISYDPNMNTSLFYFDYEGTPLWNQTWDLGVEEQIFFRYQFSNGTFLVFVHYDGNASRITMSEDGEILSNRSLNLHGEIMVHLHNTEFTFLLAKCNYTQSEDVTYFQIYKAQLDGQILWSKNLTMNHITYPLYAIETRDSGFLLYGRKAYWNAGFNDTTDDLYFLRLDALGNVLWELIYDCWSTDYFGDVIETQNGQYLSVASGQNEDYTESGGYWIRFDDNGTVIWKEDVEEGRFYEIVQLQNGDYLFIGNPTNNADLWLLRVSERQIPEPPFIPLPFSFYLALGGVVFSVIVIIVLFVFLRQRPLPRKKSD